MKHMRSTIVGWVGLAACVCVPGVVAADWMTLPGHYSHDAASGVRVSQYAPIEGPAAPTVSNFRTSGYTHLRSTLQYGQSADNYHRVEEWGDPVRPYGEWRFPYRPFSTPYPNWGLPYGGFNAGINVFNGAPGPGLGYPPGPGVPTGPPIGAGGAGYGGYPPGYGFPNPAAGADLLSPYPAGRGTPYPVAPYYDGYYPNYRD